jgi:hypothetical protein
VQDDSTALPAPIGCPYCGRPLKWTSDRWREAFECESCGKFSDFGGAASARRGFETSSRGEDDALARTTTETKEDDAREGSDS